MRLTRPLVLTLVLLAGCEKEAPPPPPEFDGGAAMRYVEEQVAFGPRIPGTDAHRRTGDWLDSLLRQRADTLIVQSWTHTTLDKKELPLRNFIARFNPSATERLLYLAHWDTRPKADAAGSRDSTAPVPGANDGASGVAILLGVADALKKQPPGIGLDLLFVDGEDYGIFDQKADVLVGTRYYANHQPPGAKPLFAVLFDMVGDKNLRLLQEGNSLIGAPEVVDRVWGLARRMGYGDIFVATPMGNVTDDHVELQAVGIRAIDVIDFEYGPKNSWWHTPDDTPDKVSAASLKAVGDVAVGMVRETGGKAVRR